MPPPCPATSPDRAHATAADLPPLPMLRNPYQKCVRSGILRGTSSRVGARRRARRCRERLSERPSLCRFSEASRITLRTVPPSTTLVTPRGVGVVAAQKSLAEMVREKVVAGTLPLDPPRQLWSGIGSGRRCTACEQPILLAQTEYELEYGEGRFPIRLHRGCYGLWEAERRRRSHPRSE